MDPSPGATISLGPVLPQASSGMFEQNRHMANLGSSPCSRLGFTEPAPLDAAGALLPHLCTLTCAWAKAGAIGGVFLWHYPHGHPHWALPSRPGHGGARTFLSTH